MCIQSWSKKYRKAFFSPYITAHFILDTFSLPACLSYIKMFLKGKTKDIPETSPSTTESSFGLLTIETDVLLLFSAFLY